MKRLYYTVKYVSIRHWNDSYASRLYTVTHYKSKIRPDQLLSRTFEDVITLWIKLNFCWSRKLKFEKVRKQEYFTGNKNR